MFSSGDDYLSSAADTSDDDDTSDIAVDNLLASLAALGDSSSDIESSDSDSEYANTLSMVAFLAF